MTIWSKCFWLSASTTLVGACLSAPDEDAGEAGPPASEAWRLQTEVRGAQHRIFNDAFEVALGARGVPLGYRLGGEVVLKEVWSLWPVPQRIGDADAPAGAREEGTARTTLTVEEALFSLTAGVFADGRVHLAVIPAALTPPPLGDVVVEVPLAAEWWPGTTGPEQEGARACFDQQGLPPSVSVALTAGSDAATFRIRDRALQVEYQPDNGARYGVVFWPSSVRSCATWNAATQRELELSCGFGGAGETMAWGEDGALRVDLAGVTEGVLACRLERPGALASLALSLRLGCGDAGACPGGRACVEGRCALDEASVASVTLSSEGGDDLGVCRLDAATGGCALMPQRVEDGRLLLVLPQLPDGEVASVALTFAP